MQRMHTLDAEFLYLEDTLSPMHIAGVSIFEGPAPGRSEVTQLFASRLGAYPCYRQRIRALPLGLGRPVWADDPHFELDYHLRWTALPAPHDDAALCVLVGRVMSQLLDRDRPLWETWIVEGLANGRWAMISKVHHALVDGISGVGLLSALLSVSAEAAPSSAAALWSPEPEPTRASLVRSAFHDLRSDLAPWARKVAALTAHPRQGAGAVREVVVGLARLAYGLRGGPSVSLRGGVGPHRAYAFASAPLEDLQQIRQVLGGTVNDVVLAVLSGAFRSLLLQRGDDVALGPLRALVPISTRAAARESSLDNQVAALFCDLPTDIADPVQRLRTISRQMSQLKRSHVPEATAWLLGVGDLCPPVLVGSITRIIARVMHHVPQRSFATVATHVQGPRCSLYLLGHKMLAYHPYVPITQGARIGTAILSYDGQISFGVTSDQDSVPEVRDFADAITHSLHELLERARQSGSIRADAAAHTHAGAGVHRGRAEGSEP